MFSISGISHSGIIQLSLPLRRGLPRFKGADVELPGPPENSRLEGRITPFILPGESRSRIYQSSIVWDESSNQFKVRVTSNFYNEKLQQYQSLTFERAMKHGTVLSNEFVEGAIVDQKAGVIRFPSGVHIDGKTGEAKSRTGKSILKD